MGTERGNDCGGEVGKGAEVKCMTGRERNRRAGTKDYELGQDEGSVALTGWELTRRGSRNWLPTYFSIACMLPEV